LESIYLHHTCFHATHTVGLIISESLHMLILACLRKTSFSYEKCAIANRAKEKIVII